MQETANLEKLKTKNLIGNVSRILQHVCDQSFLGKKIIQKKQEKVSDFTKEVLKNILISHIDLEKDEKEFIFRNVTQLDFSSQPFFSELEITNSQSCKSIIKNDTAVLMASAKFYEGRTLAFAHEDALGQFLVKDDNWIVFLRNVINWLTKNRQSSNEEPIKILILNSDSPIEISSALARASLFVKVSYESKVSSLDLDKYDCVFMSKGLSKTFSNYDCQKVIEYVREGGGLFITIGRQVDMENPEKVGDGQSPHNKILNPMGLKYHFSSVYLQTLKLQQKQSIELTVQPLKTYTKQKNPLFIYSPGQDNPLKDTKKKLLEGTGSMDLSGAWLSPFDFSQLSSMSLLKNSDQSFGVFGNFGKGKIFAFGHPVIFGKQVSQNAPSRRFIQNILNWMTNSKKEQISVGLLFKSGDDWPSYSWDQNLEMKISSKFVESAEEFSSQDIICVTYYSHYPKALTPEVIAKLKTYVANGGNLFFGCHGWVWEQYGEHQQNNSLVYEKDFASYVILKSFGIDLNKDGFGVGVYDISSNLIIAKDEKVESFLRKDLLEVLKNKDRTSFTTDAQEVDRILLKISIAEHFEFEFLCQIGLYHELVDAFVQSRFNIQKNYDQLSFKDPFICKVFDFMNALSYAVPPHICRALPPSLNKYPGYATNRIKTKTITVSKTTNKIVFTGLYLNPGQVVRITHKNNQLDLHGVQLKLNFNLNLQNYDNGNLRRFTNISRTFDIISNEFLIASPHGGILYFEVSDGQLPPRKPLAFTFEGAYEGVYWNENIHSYADFQRIKKINAPMFIIETQRMNLIGPTKGLLRSLSIPIERLCKYWNKVIGIYKQYRGIEEYPFHKDTIFNDVNIIVGYMHSGNPVMTYDDVTFEMIGLNNTIFEKGNWGFYHELGHNHQDSKWTVEETTQVTCNIYSLYLMQRMNGWSFNDFIKDRKMDEPVKNYFQQQNRTMAEYRQADLAVCLVLYGIIMDELGYETFSKVHHAFNGITLPNNSYETKFDYLVQQTSIAANCNLWDYFKSWGMPVTPASLQKVNNLPQFRCKRYPFITQVDDVIPQ